MRCTKCLQELSRPYINVVECPEGSIRFDCDNCKNIEVFVVRSMSIRKGLTFKGKSVYEENRIRVTKQREKQDGI